MFQETRAQHLRARNAGDKGMRRAREREREHDWYALLRESNPPSAETPPTRGEASCIEIFSRERAHTLLCPFPIDESANGRNEEKERERDIERSKLNSKVEGKERERERERRSGGKEKTRAMVYRF